VFGDGGGDGDDGCDDGDDNGDDECCCCIACFELVLEGPRSGECSVFLRD